MPAIVSQKHGVRLSIWYVGCPRGDGTLGDEGQDVRRFTSLYSQTPWFPAAPRETAVGDAVLTTSIMAQKIQNVSIIFIFLLAGPGFSGVLSAGSMLISALPYRRLPSAPAGVTDDSIARLQASLR